MKSLFTTLLYTLTVAICIGQCVEPVIVTDPENAANNQFLPLVQNNDNLNATYQVNSFLNSINWYPAPVAFEVNNQYYNSLGVFNPAFPVNPTPVNFSMANPLSTQNHDNFYLRYDGLQVPSSEFHWKDGWELMYVNLGKFPNDDPSNIPAPGTFYYDYYGQGVYNEVARPLTIPYFALYNRYRGLLRVFYSYWDSNTLGQKEVTVKLGIIGNTSANGTLRHGNAIDRAMDLPTISDHIVSPKRVDGESNQWGIAEFQLGYDPCVCFYQSQLLLEFQIVDDYNISM